MTALWAPSALPIRSPSAPVEHDAGEVVVDADVVVEGAGVLGEGLDGHLQAAQRLAVGPVCVRGGQDVGAGRVHRAVDGHRGTVDRAVALDDLALVADPDQVAALDHAEVHAEGVDPEGVGLGRVADGDVSGDALVQAGLAEHPERRCELGLAVRTLLLDGVERLGERHPQLATRARGVGDRCADQLIGVGLRCALLLLGDAHARPPAVGAPAVDAACRSYLTAMSVDDAAPRRHVHRRPTSSPGPVSPAPAAAAAPRTRPGCGTGRPRTRPGAPSRARAWPG